MKPLLLAKSVTKHFGGFTALDHVDITVSSGERLGLIGPNGSGKTTFINCISGTLRNDSGSVFLMALTFQHCLRINVFERVLLAVFRYQSRSPL